MGCAAFKSLCARLKPPQPSRSSQVARDADGDGTTTALEVLEPFGRVVRSGWRTPTIPQQEAQILQRGTGEREVVAFWIMVES